MDRQVGQQTNQHAIQSLDKDSRRNAKNQVKDLGNGFIDHGVAVPFATSRGTVAAVDKQGHNLVLTWLYDHRGTYSLLMIDTDEQTSKQFFVPFEVDASFTSLLSSQNRYYTHFNGHFVEFNPNKPGFSFVGKTSKGNANASSMTEDDKGIIWAALDPHCSLVSYNPKTQKLTDYGSVYSAGAKQKPRSIAADDSGWIYVTCGPPGKTRIVGFNPDSKETRLLQKEGQSGKVSLVKGQNGKVLGRVNKKTKMQFDGGERSNKVTSKKLSTNSYISGNQALYHRTFPGGERITDFISAVSSGFLATREVPIQDPETGQSRTVAFDYETEGATLMGVAANSRGMIVGGSSFPMYFFQYYPKSGEWKRSKAKGQYNTLAIHEDQLFIGAYPRGYLFQWDPDKKWNPVRERKKGANPQYLTKAHPSIKRPLDLLVYSNNKTIVMGGRPSKNRTGGGLLFWDMETQTANLLEHIPGMPNQSTQSLVALPGGRILGGTTIRPGDTGGKRLAKEAGLYIMDLGSHKVRWSKAVFPGVRHYPDLYATSNGLVMGIAEKDRFFVFDPEERKVLYQKNLKKAFGSEIPYSQGQRLFFEDDDGKIYLLLKKGIYQISPENYEITLLAKAPNEIKAGGAYLNGRIYFISSGRSHLYSYTLFPEN